MSGSDEWESRRYSAGYGPKELAAEDVRLECPHCHREFTLPQCCSSGRFIVSAMDGGTNFALCAQCHKFKSVFSCPSCHQPVPLSLQTLSVRKRASKKGCFIATAVYGTPQAPEVLTLRRFRDDVLENCAVGKAFVQLYYRLSPPIAHALTRHNTLRDMVRRAVVGPLVRIAVRLSNNREGR